MFNTRELVGRGPKFPFEPNSSGGLAETELVDRINQSLLIIFDTRKGSRLNMPDFGSNLYKYRFDPYDDILIEKIRETITEDIRRWEPRISVREIRFLADEDSLENSILYVSIYYTVVNTHVSGNFVYPFRRDVYDMSSNSVERW